MIARSVNKVPGMIAQWAGGERARYTMQTSHRGPESSTALPSDRGQP